MGPEQPAVVMEQLTDPHPIGRGAGTAERFDRNWAWFEAHAAEIYRSHRGKCFCISGEQLFVADTPAQALALAKTAHPEDDGRFTGIIPKERLPAHLCSSVVYGTSAMTVLLDLSFVARSWPATAAGCRHVF